MTPRLGAATLDRLPADVARPAYDRARMRCGVVHLGLGAFHRAHQAPVFDGLLARGDARWGILGVAMNAVDVATALAAQDALYTLVERAPGGATLRVVGALRGVAVAARDRAAVLAALAGADTHLATLTVTEKGYAAAADVAGSPAGLLAQALDRRRRAGRAPLTILSCDNLADNGAVVRAATLAAATALGVGDASLRWIAEEVAFPATMVDRITPATTPALVDEVAAALGLRDLAPVATERFTQWVVEDRFAGARPELAAMGVRLTADVGPWEALKLGLLNGAHSALAYLGQLDGRRFVHEAIAEPALLALVRRLWDETIAVLAPPAGLDLADYRRALEARFADASLAHATAQIAIDGSQKLPPRLLRPLAVRSARHLASPALALAVAGWAHALAGRSDRGAALALADPLHDALAPIARSALPPTALVDALLHAIGTAADVRARIVPEIATALDALRRSGVAHAAAQLRATPA